MGFDNIVLNSMSRFYHEKLNAKFGQFCTRMGSIIENDRKKHGGKNGGGGWKNDGGVD